MQSTRTQALFRYLPGSVFVHEDGVIVRSYRISGQHIQSVVNRKVFLEELARELENWDTSRVAGVPTPGKVPDTDFVFIEPERIDWDIWPLLFACSNRACQRAKRFRSQGDAISATDKDGKLKCKVCHHTLVQIRYYTSHECGQVQAMYIPPCKHCKSRDHVYLEDTGSFETAAWRCRNCSDAYIQGTRFMPCSCGDYGKGNRPGFMRAFPVRDQRTFYPQMISMINLESRTYEQLRLHDERGIIAIGSYLGDETKIQYALDQLSKPAGSASRFSQEEWREREEQLLELVAKGLLSEKELASIRKEQAPVSGGVGGLRELPSDVLELGEGRRLLERAMLFDPDVVPDRRNLAQARQEEEALARSNEAEAIAEAEEECKNLGIDEISVTLEFPILLGAYGFTRNRREPGKAHLRGFGRTGAYDGKTPIFAAAAKTEALLVCLSAADVVGWLREQQLLPPGDAVDERAARLVLLEEAAAATPASQQARVLVHSFAHAMLRALDDGQSGFGEASLAEWIVPEALTFGIYVSSYQSYTLGALWTLMHSRTGTWLRQTRRSMWSCLNDPLCHHRVPRACERCMYLTFGCRDFNDGLSRSVLTDFWRFLTQRSGQAAAVA